MTLVLTIDFGKAHVKAAVFDDQVMMIDVVTIPLSISYFESLIEIPRFDRERMYSLTDLNQLKNEFNTVLTVFSTLILGDQLIASKGGIDRVIVVGSSNSTTLRVRDTLMNRFALAKAIVGGLVKSDEFFLTFTNNLKLVPLSSLINNAARQSVDSVLSHKVGIVPLIRSLFRDGDKYIAVEMGTSSTAIFPFLGNDVNFSKDRYEIIKTGLFSDVATFGPRFRFRNHLHLLTSPMLLLELLGLLEDDIQVGSLFNKTTGILFSAIPYYRNLFDNGKKSDGNERILAGALYSDTYLSPDEIGPQTSRFILTRVLEELLFKIRQMISQAILAREVEEGMTLITAGLGDNLLQKVVDNLLPHTLSLSETRGKLLSAYSTLIGPGIEFARSMQGDIDVRELKVGEIILWKHSKKS